MADVERKLGDNGMPLRFRLSWDGGYDDLTGATVVFRYGLNRSSAAFTEVVGVVEDAVERIVSAEFIPAVAGTYKAEWAVTWPNTKISVFPDDGYLIIQVLPGLT